MFIGGNREVVLDLFCVSLGFGSSFIPSSLLIVSDWSLARWLLTPDRNVSPPFHFLSAPDSGLLSGHMSPMQTGSGLTFVVLFSFTRWSYDYQLLVKLIASQ